MTIDIADKFGDIVPATAKDQEQHTCKFICHQQHQRDALCKASANRLSAAVAM